MDHISHISGRLHGGTGLVSCPTWWVSILALQLLLWFLHLCHLVAPAPRSPSLTMSLFPQGFSAPSPFGLDLLWIVLLLFGIAAATRVE